MVVPGGAQFFFIEVDFGDGGDLDWWRTGELGLGGGGVGPYASPQEGRGEELSIAILDHLLDV